jgi:hypothetical protein
MRKSQIYRAMVLAVALTGATSIFSLVRIHSGFAQGGGPQLLAQFGDWVAYAASQNGQKICFALASAQSAPTQGRGKTFVMISMRPSQRVWNELSIQTNYTFGPGVEATAQLGPETLVLYTQNQGAWLKNTSEEARIVDTMRRESLFVVKGTSVGGITTVDRYSLRGMGAAIDRAAQECRGEIQTVAPQPGPPNKPVGPAPQPPSTACERFPNLC